jgi:glycosyltransferase involved in cell wall biosynthesis
MRILLMINRLWRGGGTETHVLSLGEQLVRRGHTVYLYTSGGEWVGQVKNKGIIVVQDGTMSRPGPRTVQRFSAFVKQNHIEVIHAHDSASLRLASYARTGKPVIFTLHGRYVPAGLLKQNRHLVRKFIAVSPALRNYLQNQAGISAHKIHTIINGVAMNRFRPLNKLTARTELGVPKNAFVIGYASRFTLDKQRLGLRVAQVLRGFAAQPGVRVLIAGRNSRTVLKSTPSFRVLGHVGRMQQFFNACDVVIATGRTAAEALACGVPVIVVGLGGFYGLVRPENATKMVYTNFGDHAFRSNWSNQQLQAAITTVRRGYTARRLATGKVRRQLSGQLSADNMTANTIAVYRSVRK